VYTVGPINIYSLKFLAFKVIAVSNIVFMGLQRLHDYYKVIFQFKLKPNSNSSHKLARKCKSQDEAGDEEELRSSWISFNESRVVGLCKS